MANEVGTATSFEDFFTKMVNFLTTNASLVSLGQQWQVLRIRRDNLLSLTSDLTQRSGAGERQIRHGFRYDPRTFNTQSESGDTYNTATHCTGCVAGTSNITTTLRQARAVATVRLASGGTSWHPFMIQNFRLQYSDNGTTWTTALTVDNSPVYAPNEVKLFSVPGTPGAHVYWRLVIDKVQNNNTVVIWRDMIFLEAGGTVANHFGSEVIFKAPGNAGTDEIFTGIRSEYDEANGWYNLVLNGYRGYSALEESWFKQPGALPGVGSTYTLVNPMVPLWDSTMPYWFAASGRSFRFGVKVSTSYEGGYLGFLLPYCLPNQYPYPLVVGGSMVSVGNWTTNFRYSANTMQHSLFPIPGSSGSPATEALANNTSLYMILQDGLWTWFGNRFSSQSLPDPISITWQTGVNPPTQSGCVRGVWPASTTTVTPSSANKPYREVLGGGYIVQPLILHQRFPSLQVFGELEGVFAISGFGNASENTAVINGKTHVVLQNAARTAVHEYWTIELN